MPNAVVAQTLRATLERLTQYKQYTGDKPFCLLVSMLSNFFGSVHRLSIILKHACHMTPMITAVCTVDLLIPNFFAVSLTVALLLMMKFATSLALSSM